MAGNNRKKVYWTAQIGGWGLFVLGNVLSASIQYADSRMISISGVDLPAIYIVSLFIFFVGIASTHAFRNLVLQWKWSGLNITQLIPRMLFSALVLSICFTTFNTLMTDVISGELPLIRSARTIYFWQNVLNFTVIFLLWEIIYFAVHVFENWKREVILNLELKASKTEFELNNLKAQMNPHFMFNSMNSIRALVDEDPEKAKSAITMLSGILRSNLTLGRNQTISLKDELELVEKYLSLEKIRFEERLAIEWNLDTNTLDYQIPPFMLQTIVENAIKHGISKNLEGGKIHLRIVGEDGFMIIEISNTGHYNPPSERGGIGLINTRKRLELLYGGSAVIEIIDENGCVKVQLKIPKKPIYDENIDH